MFSINAAEMFLAFLLAALVVAAVLVAGYLLIRRRRIASDGRPVMLCAMRAAGSDRWQLGMARLGAERFEWFQLFGWSWRPEITWVRGAMDVGGAHPVTDPIPGLAEPVGVTATVAGASSDFAFAPAAYTAVRSWLESSPPGYNSNVV